MGASDPGVGSLMGFSYKFVNPYRAGIDFRSALYWIFTSLV